MNKKSLTPPARKQSKSPQNRCNIVSRSKKDLLMMRPPHFTRGNASASRSASRLNDHSQRAVSKSYRRDYKQSSTKAFSLGKKKHSLSHAEIGILINQFQHLKTAYQDLLQTKREQVEKDASSQQMVEDYSKMKKQYEKLKGQNQHYQSELERIKKQCIKLVEIQGFKIKKLQQTLQQKQLMLQYLRNNQTQNHVNHAQPQVNVFLQSTPIFKSQEFSHHKAPSIPSNLSLLSLEQISAIQLIQRNNFLLSSIHGQIKGTLSSQDSLVFSKDRSKSNNIHLESLHMSPPQFKKQQLSCNNRIQPNCPTFDLKDLQGGQKFHCQLIQSEDGQRPRKKHLKIDTDHKSIMGVNASYEDLISHSTKKRITIPSTSNNNQSQQNIPSSENVERKKKRQKESKISKLDNIDKIEVHLPGKDKKTIKQHRVILR